MCFINRRNTLAGGCRSVTAQAAPKNGAGGAGQYDYDLVIIGAGVGGHGAAMHAVECVSPAACHASAYTLVLLCCNHCAHPRAAPLAA